MNNTVKLIYALSLGKQNLENSVNYYVKYANSVERRIYKYSFVPPFNFYSNITKQQLVEYLQYPDYYTTKAKKHWEELRDEIVKNGGKYNEWDE